MNLKRRSKAGSILVFVLVLIVLLSVVATRLMQETVQELRYVSQQHYRDNLRIHAYSLLDLTVGVINEFAMIERTLYSPAQGWGNPLEYSEIKSFEEGVKWQVKISDESGKAPLSLIKEKDLVSLFAYMQAEDSLIDEDDGQPFYDAFMDWQDQDDEDREEGAEDDYYEELDPPYYTPGKKIQNFEEFRMVKGFAFEEDDRENSGIFYDEFGNETLNMKNFKDSFSFFHDGKVNLNGASDFLVRFLCGDDDRLYEDFLNGPSSSSEESGFYTSLNDPNISQIGQNSGIGLSTVVSMLRLEVLVSKGKANFQLHVVLALNGGNQNQAINAPNKKRKARSSQNQKIKYPFRILSLRENENLID